MLPHPSEAPIKLEHVRWRHKERGYLVTVAQTENYRGSHGFVTFVKVHRKGHRDVSWPAQTFLATFSPVGRKVVRRSRAERLELDLPD